MSYKNNPIRLQFWLNEPKRLASDFLADFIPRVGEVWHVPLGTDNYHNEEGSVKVRIISVRVKLLGIDQPIDVHLACEILHKETEM